MAFLDSSVLSLPSRGLLSRTLGGLAAVAVAVALLAGAAGCESPSSAAACTTNTDCPSGTICGGDARCVAFSPPDGDTRSAQQITTPAPDAAPAPSPDAGVSSTPDAADATAGGNTLVDLCSATLVCGVSDTIQGSVYECEGMLIRENGACFFRRSHLGVALSDELDPNGIVAGGRWTSDADHVIVDIGSGSVVSTCTAQR